MYSVAPLPMNRGCSYLRFTRFPAAVLTQNITAATFAPSLMDHWFAFFGVPATILTELGTQFESTLFNEITKLL